MINKEAIGHIKDIICENNTIKPNITIFKQEKEALYMAIEALEQTQWILVSDKLPETNEEAYSNDVFLSLKETDWDMDECRMTHITVIGRYDEAAVSSDGRYMDTEGWVLKDGIRLPLSEVEAWMPLPKLYKSEKR